MKRKDIAVFLMLLGLVVVLEAQVGESEKRYVRIGELQSHFTAYGSERAWNNQYYEGLIWPADYPYQDNAVIKRAWIAVRDFTDATGYHWDYYGIYFAKGYVQQSLFPMELKQTAKFEMPIVYVDGNNITLPYLGDVDGINPEQVPDRIITNVVNTSIGLTMTRRILAFSQQYHDDYFIKEFIFKNTGNVDYDDEIELVDSLRGVRIGWGVRYSVCREGAFKSDNQQSWGKHSWVSIRGENYADHHGEQLTESDGIVEWIRCGFEWMGQSEKLSYDNIGAPDIRGDGRLCAPQFAGIAVLHVDKGPHDKSDDPRQPCVLGWHAGDSYPSVGDLTPTDEPNMMRLYEFLSGVPYPSEKMGKNRSRMDEEFLTSITDRFDPYTAHNDGGGTNVWITYGPFDLAPGDSIVIVEAEGINGLSRKMCQIIGRRWKQAYDDPNDKGPFPLPPDSSETTDDKDYFKNSWVYTGRDSLLLVFSRAKRNYDSGYQIPQPPLPPPLFEVNSGGDKVTLSWSPSPSESSQDFAGYRIYRAAGKPDTVFDMIAELPPGTTIYEDYSAQRGVAYYYYITAYNDGSNNTSGVTNPTGPLESSRFYTKTTEPAYLRRKSGASLKDIRIVPNPYNKRARDLQYLEEPDKIMFLDIPGYCVIKIYTERGDLIATINHDDGSGDETWNCVTSSRQVVVSGIYLAYFEVTKDIKDPKTGESLFRKGDSIIKKFIVIR